MKVSAQEEFGLRCMVQLARRQQESDGHPLTLAEIARDEGLTVPNVAKLVRRLRRAGLVRSALGRTGGYTLSRDARTVNIAEILGALGGKLFDAEYCTRYAGDQEICTHIGDCSIRSLWGALEAIFERVLEQTTLAELLGTEERMATVLDGRAPATIATIPITRGCR